MFPLGRAKLSGVFENFFVLQKTPSLIWTKGAEMHTHFRTFSRKFFEKNSPFTYSHCEKPNAHPISKNLSLHLFGIGKSKRTLFLRKNFEKYFLFGCGTAYFTYLKSPFTYLEFECKNATCLSEKTEKIFLKRSFVLKTYPHLFPLGEGVWGQ